MDLLILHVTQVKLNLQATTKFIKTDASFSRHSLILPGENTLTLYIHMKKYGRLEHGHFE